MCIDCTLTKKLQLPLQPLQHPLKVQALDGGPIGEGSVTHYTEPITLHVPGGSGHPMDADPQPPDLLEGERNHALVAHCHTNCLLVPSNVASTSIESPKT